MPHVWRINRNYKIHAIVLLKNGKFFCIDGVWTLRNRIEVFAFWFKRGIKLKFEPWCREKIRDPLKLK